jgi:hypothetical protein
MVVTGGWLCSASGGFFFGSEYQDVVAWEIRAKSK